MARSRRGGCRPYPTCLLAELRIRQPGLVAGRAPGQSTALVVVVVSCQRQRRCTRYGSTSIQEQGGPKTRTVPYGAGSTGSDWARHWGAGEHRAHLSGTDTTPPRPGALLARSAAGRIKRVQLGRGKDVIRQATSIVEHRVHGMCAELSSQKGRPPPDGQGRGLHAPGADRVHRPTSQ